jgi:hypothetical protein
MIVPPLTSLRLDNTTTGNRKLIINYKDFVVALTSTAGGVEEKEERNHRYYPTKAWYDKENGMFHYELTMTVEFGRGGEEEEEQ